MKDVQCLSEVQTAANGGKDNMHSGELKVPEVAPHGSQFGGKTNKNKNKNLNAKNQLSKSF